MFDLSFYKNKKVLITGHTGFKGSWMCSVLLMAGANVLGYSLEAPTTPSLFNILGYDKSIGKDIVSEEGGKLRTVIGDIRNLKQMMDTFSMFEPEIVIHMAAQPIVLTSYKDPVNTYEINVMGTVNVLECVRQCKTVKSFVNVTTDKVYLNREWQWGYRENEELNGYDPYSNSKSCSELVTSSYINSFFIPEINAGRHIAITTMRAGNVIGGGDFADNRIVPDIIRAAQNGNVLEIRNPYSTRPYQHVLEPVMAYLMVAAKQFEDIAYASSYNVGPDENDAWETGKLADIFCNKWNDKTDKNSSLNKLAWKNLSKSDAPHEANYLKLDCSKLKNRFNWKPVWNISEAIDKIIEWTIAYFKNEKMDICMKKQITAYLEK